MGMLTNIELLNPILEMLIISGGTFCLLGVLYRQLPFPLIPDCIPFIGKYDSMLAQMFAFIGFVSFVVGIYMQWHYVGKPMRKPLAADMTEDNWSDVGAAVYEFIGKRANITKQSATIMYEQLKNQIGHILVDSFENSNATRND